MTINKLLKKHQPDCHFQDESGNWMWAYSKEMLEGLSSNLNAALEIDFSEPFNGDIEGFPKEVVRKMIERQVEQGNPPDVSVFEHDAWANKDEGGFDWDATVETDTFWDDVIFEKNFNLFFKKYLK